MNTIEIIKEQQVLGKAFKVYGTIEHPLFLAKDVAQWIDYDKSKSARLAEGLDATEKVRRNVSTLGGIQEQLLITEDGLYEILMQSRKPIAKAFKKEVKAILKQIRLTGGAIAKDRESEFIEAYFPNFTNLYNGKTTQ